jgi:hypothetical protein
MARITAQQLQRQLNDMLRNATGRQTEAAVAKVLSIGITGAKELAPMEYGTLINSAFRRIYPEGRDIVGIAGFAVSYAFHLHEITTWNNRAPEDKEGTAWNPNGEPKFLEKGFTSSGQLTLMHRALRSSYRTT